jgi:hypothetical protein
VVLGGLERRVCRRTKLEDSIRPPPPAEEGWGVVLLAHKEEISGHCHVIVKWLPYLIVFRCVALYREISKRKGLCNSGIQGGTASDAPRSLQGLAPARVCGFKSRLRHQLFARGSLKSLSGLTIPLSFLLQSCF